MIYISGVFQERVSNVNLGWAASTEGLFIGVSAE